MACLDRRVEDENRQRELGQYLYKVIGRYGVENYNFDTFRTDAGNMFAYDKMKNFSHLKDNIFLNGVCGTGKTHLAGAVLKNVCGKNLRAKWENPIYLTRFVKKYFGQDEDKIVADLVSQDVLIIDDIGVGQDLSTILRLLYEICDKRKANKKNGLIITSNLSMDELGQHYKDDRVPSRIAGLCEIVTIAGVDRRIQND